MTLTPTLTLTLTPTLTPNLAENNSLDTPCLVQIVLVVRLFGFDLNERARSLAAQRTVGAATAPRDHDTA